MHKNTLADIVIKAVRFANSVIDSSYEFPDMDIRTNEETAFRDNVIKYCHACHDDSKKEERAAYTQNILEHVASLYKDERVEKLPLLLKAAKVCRIATRMGLGISIAGSAVNRLFLLGVGFGAYNLFYEKTCKNVYGQPFEKELDEQYLECKQNKDIAGELKAVTQKEFNEAMFEHWDDLIAALDDVSEQEKKRLSGKKSWE